MLICLKLCLKPSQDRIPGVGKPERIVRCSYLQGPLSPTGKATKANRYNRTGRRPSM